MRAAKHIFAKLAFLLVLSIGMAAPAHADALDNALRSGQVGETQRGYVAAVKSPSGSITRLINNINSRRRAEYANIAKRNNLTLQQVEALVGKKIIGRAPAGTYYKDSRGKWRRK